ncbi:MAG: Holliday junction branch migration protein RuvA [Gracilibacteraceae bacterium]|jgi:Holliday junction DNA helicase RuvA|nr:Holliday junction branch migration protein RuvA [Gracilibacteraceae bacterium]
MIGLLKGTIEALTPEQVLISVGGVGFEAGTPTRLTAGLRAGQEIVLYTVMLTREDDISLYGFGSQDDRNLFRLLISVSGVGPKAALGLLSVFAAPELKKAIAAEDAAMLTRAPGIGVKIARRLILELKGKIGDAAFGETDPEAGPPAGAIGDEAMEALLGYGFARMEARQALNKVLSAEGELSPPEQIQRALRLLVPGK